MKRINACMVFFLLLLMNIQNIHAQNIEDEIQELEVQIARLQAQLVALKNREELQLNNSTDFIRQQSCPFRRIEKPFFTICYRDEWKIPVWVGYRLDAKALEGDVGRTNDFRIDNDVPLLFQSTKADYAGSGFDRGHMAPAEAFDTTEAEMSSTFFMSNMAPQRGHMNRGRWRALENRVRKVAAMEGQIWVFTGNIVSDGELDVIGNGVVVPDTSFKVILWQKDDGVLHSYGFSIPNVRAGLSGRKITSFQTTVDDIENKVDIDFFTALPNAIETNIESVVSDWPAK